MAISTGLTIAEAAEASGLTPHALRYYERAGLIHEVDRIGSGHRRYDEDDLAWIRVVQQEDRNLRGDDR